MSVHFVHVLLLLLPLSLDPPFIAEVSSFDNIGFLVSDLYMTCAVAG